MQRYEARSRSRWLGVALAAVLTGGCGAGAASPTGPSAIDRSMELLTIGCGTELDGYRCYLRYGAGESQRDVTGLATWSSSDTSIATVNSIGFVTVQRAGSVAIRARYQDLETFIALDVDPGGLRQYYRAVSGFVTDAQNGAYLDGVTVTIVDGANAGRTTSTRSTGEYQMYDLAVDTFTVRFSKSGYATLDRRFTLTGDRFNDLSVALTKSS